jgi:DNA repair protein RadC
LALRLALGDPMEDARVRRRWLEDRALQPGDVGLDDIEALSVLCGLDEPAAEALLDAFGSLPELIAAPAADLARVAGRRAAVRLRLVQPLARRLLERPLRDRPVICGPRFRVSLESSSASCSSTRRTD